MKLFNIYLRSVVLSGTLMSCPPVSGQYAPAAGEPGSNAISQSDSRIVEWAAHCTVQRGYIQRSDTSLTYTEGDSTSNRAFYGNASDATGAPGGILDCVSLGDGGQAVVSFEHPVKNGDGPDFAVFENGMKMPQAPYLYFLELAFVDVSTDGIRYVRFPSVSLTQTSSQIEAFGQLDPQKINNLAGKYVSGYGTPFDLEELKDSAGINIDSITRIRITDVTGSIDPAYASYDSKGNIINDPFPTPFWNGGFDLEAVGVLNSTYIPLTISTAHQQKECRIYPNPVAPGNTCGVISENTGQNLFQLSLMNSSGKNLWNSTMQMSGGRGSFTFPDLNPGIYFLRIFTDKTQEIHKILVTP